VLPGPLGRHGGDLRYRGSVAVCLVFWQASLMRQAGKGIAIDFPGALVLYVEAARRGDPEGQYMQAICHNGARRRGARHFSVSSDARYRGRTPTRCRRRDDFRRVPRYSRTGSSDGGSSSVMVCSVPGAVRSLACRRKIAVAAHAEEASRSQPQEHLMRQLGREAVTGGPAREVAWLREGTSEAERARLQSTAMLTPASRPKV